MSSIRRPVIIKYMNKEVEGYLIHLGTIGSSDKGFQTEAIIELYDRSIIHINSSCLVRFNDLDENATLSTTLLVKEDLECLHLSEAGILNLCNTMKGLMVFDTVNKVDKPVGRVDSATFNPAVKSIIGNICFTDSVDMNGKTFSVRAKLTGDTFSISCVNIVSSTI